jgi:hypothetical protein
VTLLDAVAGLLTRERVPHALIGAAALASAGVARSTFDVDLLTTDQRVLAPAFWTPFAEDPVTVAARRGDDDDPLAGVVRLERTGDRPVDVIVGRHGWQADAVARATAAGGGIPVVQPADLVLLKLYAGGTQDLWDIRELLALPGGEALTRAVDRALDHLPQFMRDHWDRARTP